MRGSEEETERKGVGDRNVLMEGRKEQEGCEEGQKQGRKRGRRED